MITLVVFSKDRAMQLDSLLRSVKEHCTGVDEVVVVGKASSAVHTDAYKLLSKTWEGDPLVLMEYTKEESFWGDDGRTFGQTHAHVLSHIKGNAIDHVALAVDDQLFYAPSDFAGAAEVLDVRGGFVWSWRLGEIEPAKFGGNALPGAEPSGLPHWSCSPLVADRDYGYLWHSDGALYKTADYVKMLDACLPDWRTGAYTPNDLEAAVASRKRVWALHVGPHLGPLKPTCITWQLNRVQTKYGSPAAEIPETNVDALAQAYLDGKRVDNEKLYAALRENPLRWNPPGARPTHVYASEEASRVWAECVR